MKLDKSQVQRCAIFLFFDKDGIVDKYIENMLADLQKNVDYLLVVCNGFVDFQGLKRLKNVSNEVLCRANLGFDVGGYREGLFYLGWKELEKYDEIVLMNYTFFGPLYPFKEMFDTMSERDVDFWGLTKFHKVDGDPFHAISYGYIPEHLQSHFLVLRREFFMSYQYRDFIMNMKNPNSYTESICSYEAIFTKYFSDLGFQWAVYTDSTEYEGYSFYPVMFYAKDVIEEKRCPIIKRRSFFTDYTDFLLNTCGEASVEAYEYIRQNNLYDTDLIWENILRLENMTAVHRSLHLNYILESYGTEYDWTDHIALIVFLDHNLENMRVYETLKSFSETIDLYICWIYEKDQVDFGKQLRGESTQNIDYIKAVYEMSEKLQGQNYDFVGVLCLDSERRNWENLFGNKYIIGNMIEAFKRDEKLGICIPPLQIDEKSYLQIADGWGNYFSKVKDILKQKGVSVNISDKERPLSPQEGTFWIRGDLFFKVVPQLSEEEKIPALLAIPFLVQNMGYYTGVGYNDDLISDSITNQDYILRENNIMLFKNYGPTYQHLVVDRIKNDDFSAGEQ